MEHFQIFRCSVVYNIYYNCTQYRLPLTTFTYLPISTDISMNCLQYLSSNAYRSLIIGEI